MPGTTTTFGFRYQLPAEPPDGAALGKNLAEDVEARILAERITLAGRIVQATAQTGLADNATVAVTFAAADELDPAGFHNPASNNTRVTPNVPGWYRIHGAVSFVGAIDYVALQAFLAKNGTGIAPANRVTTGGTQSQTIVLPTSALISFNGTTDYVELMANADKGTGTWATTVSVQFASVLEWEFVRPL